MTNTQELIKTIEGMKKNYKAESDEESIYKEGYNDALAEVLSFLTTKLEEMEKKIREEERLNVDILLGKRYDYWLDEQATGHDIDAASAFADAIAYLRSELSQQKEK